MRRLLPCCLKRESNGESESAPLTSPRESRSASSSSGSFSTPTPASTAADGEQLVDSLNAFGARLFVQLGQRLEGNFCTAPLSVALSRCQVKVGESDRGGEEMARALELLGFLKVLLPLSLDRHKPSAIVFHFDKSVLHHKIERAKRAALEQSLLVDTRAPLGVELNWKGAHADRLDRVYISMGLLSDDVFRYWCEIRRVNFAAPEFECERFNEYVRAVSGGLVPQALGTVHSGTRLLLFSADHLRGELRVPFNSRLSEEREFALSPARALHTRMLVCQHMRVPFARYVHPRYRLSLAALPLRLEQPTGLALELDILLPDDHDDFHALQEALNADAGRLCELLEQLRTAERSDVSVVLPPLRLQSQLDFASPFAPAAPSTERAVQTSTLLRQCLVDNAMGVPDEFKYSMRAIHLTTLDVKFSRADGVKLYRASSGRSRQRLHCERPFFFAVRARARPEKGASDVISNCPLYIAGRYCTPPPAAHALNSNSAQSTPFPQPFTAENGHDLTRRIDQPFGGTQ